MKRLSTLLLLLSLTFSGCNSKSENIVEISPTSSSNEALDRMLEAMSQRDKNALLSLVSGSPEAQNFFASVIESFDAVDTFGQKFIDVHGEEAWEAFQAPPPDGDKRPDMKLTMPDLEQIRKDASDWESNEENQGVFDVLPGVAIPFTKGDGGWVIDGNRVFPDEETLIGFTESQRKITDFIKSYMKAIGSSGISPEDIDYQMGKDFMILLMGGEFKGGDESPNPDRFKLDEI